MGRKDFSNLTTALEELTEELTEGPALCINPICEPSESSLEYNLLPSYQKDPRQPFHPVKLNSNLDLFIIVLPFLQPPYGAGRSPLYSESL